MLGILEEHLRLRNEYERSYGVKIQKIIIELNTYKYFLDKNTEELQKKIEFFENNWITYFPSESEESKIKWRNYTKEFMRVFHNYLMALYSFYDKTKGWRDSLRKDFRNIFSQYDEKVIEFKLKEYGDYLRELRREFAHKKTKEPFNRVLFYKHHLKIKKGTIEFRDLKKEVKDVINIYNNSVSDFHNCMIGMIKETFSEEIKEANRIYDQIKGQEGANYSIE